MALRRPPAKAAHLVITIGQRATGHGPVLPALRDPGGPEPKMTLKYSCKNDPQIQLNKFITFIILIGGNPQISVFFRHRRNDLNDRVELSENGRQHFPGVISLAFQTYAHNRS